MKNFLFVYPKVVEYGQLYDFPLGLAYVVSNLKKNGFNVHCLDLCHHSGPIEHVLSEYIERNHIDILCTGAMTIYWNEISQLLKTAKKIKPDLITVVGGAIVTATPKLAIEKLSFDYGIIGEGEEAMVELAEALCNEQDTAHINGLIYYDENKKIIKTKSRESINNLDSLPFPDYEGLQYDKWLQLKWSQYNPINGLLFDIFERPKISDIITSRSCPYSCTFCYHPLGTKYRQRSVENVFKEIDYLMGKYNVGIVNFNDELFSVNEKRVYSFIDGLKKRNLRWMASWRVPNINKEMLDALKSSGILFVSLGVESMSDKILKSMNKKTTTAQIDKAFKLAHEEGVRTGGNLILGDPEETEETIKESLDWYFKHPEYNIQLGLILAIPDAPIYRKAVEEQIIVDELSHIKSRFPVLNLTKISDRRFNALVRKMRNWGSLTNRMTGEVMSSKKETEMFEGKNIYTFEIKCSDCGKISKYRYMMYSPRIYSPIVCKQCYKDLKMKTGEAFYDDYNAFYANAIQLGIYGYNLCLARFGFFSRLFARIRDSIRNRYQYRAETA